MKAENFNAIVREQLQMCTDTLGVKAGEYAQGGDRLHNFRKSARRKKKNMRQVLAGMYEKHLVSLDDLMEADETNPDLTIWNEKITDGINYLLLLKAIAMEELGEIAPEKTAAPPIRSNVNWLEER